MAKLDISNRIQEVATDEKSNWLQDAKYRRQNRDWLNRSFHIAFKILATLEHKGWSQKQLAREMAVPPQRVNKIVKGKENLTLATIAKIEAVLGIMLIEISGTDDWQNQDDDL